VAKLLNGAAIVDEVTCRTGAVVGLGVVESPLEPGEAAVVGIAVLGGVRKSTGTREVGGS